MAETRSVRKVSYTKSKPYAQRSERKVLRQVLMAKDRLITRRDVAIATAMTCAQQG